MKLADEPRPSFRCGSFIVDRNACRVLLADADMHVSATAFEVFYQLVERKGLVVRREEFGRWSGRGAPSAHPYRIPVDMCVTQLRRKLGRSLVETVPGIGYKLGSGFAVEIIAAPSANELDRMLSIALAQVKEHSSRSLRAAIDKCEDLIRMGSIPDASALLSLIYINLGHVGFCRELPTIAIAKARAIIQESLRHYPKFSSAFALRGLASLIHEYDWQTAQKDFNRALHLNPNNELAHCFLAHLFAAKRMFGACLKHARRAAELDYDSRMTVITEPWLMMFAERIEDAVVTAERVVKSFSDFAIGHVLLGHIYRTAGAPEKALKEYEKSLEIEFFPEALASIGFVYGQLGRRKDAVNCLRNLKEAKEQVPLAYVSSYFDALIFTSIGDEDKALAALEKSFREKCDWLIFLEVEPRWTALRNHQRFKALARRVGLRSGDGAA